MVFVRLVRVLEDVLQRIRVRREAAGNQRGQRNSE
jgi:hypothetical protein